MFEINYINQFKNSYEKIKYLLLDEKNIDNILNIIEKEEKKSFYNNEEIIITKKELGGFKIFIKNIFKISYQKLNCQFPEELISEYVFFKRHYGKGFIDDEPLKKQCYELIKIKFINHYNNIKI